VDVRSGQRTIWASPPGAGKVGLCMAHERLDAAAFAAYGWETPLEDKELLARLLALNLVREPLPARKARPPRARRRAG